jgi:mRNA interferase MazF
VTSQVKGYPFEVVLPPGLKVQGAILSDQLKSLDWRIRKAQYLCTISREVLDDAVARILALVDPE